MSENNRGFFETDTVQQTQLHVHKKLVTYHFSATIQCFDAGGWVTKGHTASEFLLKPKPN